MLYYCGLFYELCIFQALQSTMWFVESTLSQKKKIVVLPASGISECLSRLFGFFFFIFLTKIGYIVDPNFFHFIFEDGLVSEGNTNFPLDLSSPVFAVIFVWPTDPFIIFTQISRVVKFVRLIWHSSSVLRVVERSAYFGTFWDDLSHSAPPHTLLQKTILDMQVQCMGPKTETENGCIVLKWNF